MITSFEKESAEKFSRLFYQNKQWLIKPVLNGRSLTRTTTFCAYSIRGLKRNQPFTIGVSTSESPSTAALGAMGEAVERFCLAHVKPDLRRKTYRELARKRLRLLDSGQMKRFCESQSVVRSGQALNITADMRVDWTCFTDPFADDEKIMVPSRANEFFRAELPVYFSGSSSGAACGASREHARYKAAMELIERDAVLFYWWTRNSPPLLKFEKHEKRTLEIETTFGPVLQKTRLYFLPMDHGVPVVMATYRGRLQDREPRFAVTAAADLDVDAAVSKALCELVQSVMQFDLQFERYPKFKSSNFDESIWTFSDHVALYGFNPMKKAHSFLDDASLKIAFASIKRPCAASFETKYRQMISALRDGGIDVYFRDNSLPRVSSAGLTVVRAFSPQLIPLNSMHRFTQHGLSRLYTLADQLKLKRRPRNSSQLNPYPHPFP